MSVDRFRFVSPGVFINEIDRSQIPRVLAVRPGPAIIGRAQRGPALKPVTVNSFNEFVEIFGNPIPGGKGGDVWAEGNYSAPTYAAFAAQAYLANDGPINFVRLLGDQDPGATTDEGKAGWRIPDLSTTEGNGVYGLFIFTSGSAAVNAANPNAGPQGPDKGNHVSGTLAAMFYVNQSASIQLAGAGLTSSSLGSASQGTGMFLQTTANVGQKEFKIVVQNSAGTTQLASTFNFDRSSGRYIRKVFNTNPQLTNTSITPSANQELYWLGETFDRNVRDNFPGYGSEVLFGVIVGMGSGSSFSAGEFKTGFQKPETPPIIAQDEGEASSFNLNNTPSELFKVIALDSAEWLQNNIKISIIDVKASPNPDYEPYGTFGLQVRKLSDVDTTPQVLEQFNNLNLNPNSPNYIARQIGDMFSVWNTDLRKYRDLGEYPNLSKYIRVDMLSWRGSPEHLLPFGYKGIPKWRGFNFTSGSAVFSTLNLSGSSQGGTGSVAEKNTDEDSNIFAMGSGSIYRVGPSTWSNIDASTDNMALYPRLFTTLGNTQNKATATIAITSTMDTGETITIIDYAGNSKTYTASAAEDTSANEFRHADAGTSGDSLQNCIDDSTDGQGNTITVSNDSAGTLTLTQDVGSAAGNKLIVSTLSNTTITQWSGGTTALNVNGLTASFQYPILPVRLSSSDGGITDGTNAYWGFATTKSRSSVVFEPSVREHLRMRPVEFERTAPGSDNFLERGPGFSLDDLVYIAHNGQVVHSGSAMLGLAGSGSFAYQQAGALLGDATRKQLGSRAQGLSMTAVSSSYEQVLAQGYDRFTVPLYGGFDGLEITEAEPFSNTSRGVGATGTTPAEISNAMFYTVKKAINTVADTEVVDTNLLAVPGITNIGLTNHALTVAQERADTLAVIDLEGGYTSSYENTDSFNDRAGSSAGVISKIKSRAINNSYGATYYPWVQAIDSLTGVRIWMPPSVAAIGTYASSARRSELWFAPAGFNRGGLTQGSAGIPVVGVIEKLSSKQRDDLYEVNINPIASFPNEGIVIFGQKTLQATPSALDRVNVRRLLIFLKKQISRIATTILFDPNVQVTWDRFLGQVTPLLKSVQSRFGLQEYRVVLDQTTTTPELIDRNIMYAKVFLKPTRAIEFIALDFIITRTGASFDD